MAQIKHNEDMNLMARDRLARIEEQRKYNRCVYITGFTDGNDNIGSEMMLLVVNTKLITHRYKLGKATIC